MFERYQLIIMVFLVRGRGTENIEKKKKTDIRKTLKNEKKKNPKNRRKVK